MIKMKTSYFLESWYAAFTCSESVDCYPSPWFTHCNMQLGTLRSSTVKDSLRFTELLNVEAGVKVRLE